MAVCADMSGGSRRIALAVLGCVSALLHRYLARVGMVLVWVRLFLLGSETMAVL